MNKIDLFNEVLHLARPLAGSEVIKSTSLEDSFLDLGVDSLDVTLIISYMCEIYGISNEDSMTFFPKTVGELFDQIDKVKTKDPKTLDEALGSL